MAPFMVPVDKAPVTSVPAPAVLRGTRALSGFIGFKGGVGGGLIKWSS